MSLEIPNLLRLGAGAGGPFEALSIVSIDPKGENACVTARWRKTVSKVVYLNPLDLYRAGSVGFNPLKALDPQKPAFFQHARRLPKH